jgi:hypothetical protein
MRTTRVLSAALLLVGMAAFADDGTKVLIDFEKSDAGKPPADFTSDVLGGGGASRWEVVEDDKAPSGKRVLAQTSADDTNKRYPVCAYDKHSAKDATVTVRFKAVSGKVDQAGGICVRFKDAKNYYVIRANALEGNVRFYKVVDGERKQLAGADLAVSAGEWHTLSLEAKGGHFVGSFDGKKVLEADDATFKDAGKVALWTKADSVTRFDDLVIE